MNKPRRLKSIDSYQTLVRNPIQQFDYLDVKPNNPRFPDGGYGWVVVLMGFFATFTVIGFSYSFGVLILAYQKAEIGHISILSFIASTNIALLGMGSIVSGWLNAEFGHRRCILVGGSIYSLSLLCSSWSYEAWHLILLQGVMMGFGGSLVFMSVIAAPMRWFESKRGLACGLTMAGAGVGGLFWAPVIQRLIPNIGINWTIRVTSLISWPILMAVGLLIRDPKISLRSQIKLRPRLSLKLSLFKQTSFSLLFTSIAIGSLGFTIPILTMNSYAIAFGFNHHEAAILIGIINGSSALGRIILGVIADYLGYINTLLLSTLTMSLSCLFLWPIATTFDSLTLFAIIYGIAIGGFVSLPPVVSAQLFGPLNVPTVTGLIYFGSGLPSLLSMPLATYLQHHYAPPSPPSSTSTTLSPNYLPTILYTGTSNLLACLMIVLLKQQVQKLGWFQKV